MDSLATLLDRTPTALRVVIAWTIVVTVVAGTNYIATRVGSTPTRGATRLEQPRLLLEEASATVQPPPAKPRPSTGALPPPTEGGRRDRDRHPHRGKRSTARHTAFRMRLGARRSLRCAANPAGVAVDVLSMCEEPPDTATLPRSAPGGARAAYIRTLTCAFAVFNSIRFAAYLPTVWAIHVSGDSSQHSLWTWCTWLGANATMAAWMYEQNGQRISRVVAVNACNAAMCSVVTVLIIVARM